MSSLVLTLNQLDSTSPQSPNSQQVAQDIDNQTITIARIDSPNPASTLTIENKGTALSSDGPWKLLRISLDGLANREITEDVFGKDGQKEKAEAERLFKEIQEEMGRQYPSPVVFVSFTFGTCTLADGTEVSVPGGTAHPHIQALRKFCEVGEEKIYWPDCPEGYFGNQNGPSPFTATTYRINQWKEGMPFRPRETKATRGKKRDHLDQKRSLFNEFKQQLLGHFAAKQLRDACITWNTAFASEALTWILDCPKDLAEPCTLELYHARKLILIEELKQIRSGMPGKPDWDTPLSPEEEQFIAEVAALPLSLEEGYRGAFSGFSLPKDALEKVVYHLFALVYEHDEEKREKKLELLLKHPYVKGVFTQDTLERIIREVRERKKELEKPAASTSANSKQPSAAAAQPANNSSQLPSAAQPIPPVAPVVPTVQNNPPTLIPGP